MIAYHSDRRESTLLAQGFRLRKWICIALAQTSDNRPFHAI